MKKYLNIWLFFFALTAFEYYALNFNTNLSLLLKLQAKGFIRESYEISPKPGRPLSLWLGWLGLGLMVTMNVYSMRKRFDFMKGLGKLSSWLNFHVFCGLLGPTFILFHSNFKVRGIVGISFWSMVVSFTSGIVGKYFYVQMLKEKNSFETEAEKRLKQLDNILEKAKIGIDEKKKYLAKALAYVGVPNLNEADGINPITVLFSALVGDIRMLFNYPPRPSHWPAGTEYIMAEYALNKRKSLFLEPFQRLMGYWHAFHFPFAVFMYIAAIIHVISALIFGV